MTEASDVFDELEKAIAAWKARAELAERDALNLRNNMLAEVQPRRKAEAERDKLAERVEAVLQLHVDSERYPGECAGCIVHDWPCPTVKALNGDSR